MCFCVFSYFCIITFLYIETVIPLFLCLPQCPLWHQSITVNGRHYQTRFCWRFLLFLPLMGSFLLHCCSVACSVQGLHRKTLCCNLSVLNGPNTMRTTCPYWPELQLVLFVHALVFFRSSNKKNSLHSKLPQNSGGLFFEILIVYF